MQTWYRWKLKVGMIHVCHPPAIAPAETTANDDLAGDKSRDALGLLLFHIVRGYCFCLYVWALQQQQQQQATKRKQVCPERPQTGHVFLTPAPAEANFFTLHRVCGTNYRNGEHLKSLANTNKSFFPG